MDIYLGHISLEHCSGGEFFLQVARTVGFEAYIADNLSLDIVTGKSFIWETWRTYLTLVNDPDDIY